MLTYNGSLFGTCIVYTFPALMCMRLQQQADGRVANSALVTRGADGDSEDTNSSCGYDYKFLQNPNDCVSVIVQFSFHMEKRTFGKFISTVAVFVFVCYWVCILCASAGDCGVGNHHGCAGVCDDAIQTSVHLSKMLDAECVNMKKTTAG